MPGMRICVMDVSTARKLLGNRRSGKKRREPNRNWNSHRLSPLDPGRRMSCAFGENRRNSLRAGMFR